MHNHTCEVILSWFFPHLCAASKVTWCIILTYEDYHAHYLKQPLIESIGRKNKVQHSSKIKKKIKKREKMKKKIK